MRAGTAWPQVPVKGSGSFSSLSLLAPKDDDEEDNLLDAAASDRLVCTLRPGLTP